MESKELALAGSIMAPVAADVVGALAKIVRKLKELRTAATKRCNVADENRAEQGVPLEDMDESGIVGIGLGAAKRREARTITRIVLRLRVAKAEQ